MNMDAETDVKILAVDDLDENLLALTALLQDKGLVILTARSGVEALELLLVHDVALALVDVQMPELDGFELAELMRGSERTRHVPIIFVTAGVREPARVFQGYDAGAVDFLFKPIDPRILRHKVQTFVELYRQRRLLSDQLTALQRSEAEARRLRDELADMLRLNETFLAIVGHDLRNPLNAVLMSTALLEHVSHDPLQRRSVERISSAAKRMSRMIDDLYDLTRVRMSGGIPLQPRPDVDVGEIAERVVNELGATYAGRAVCIERLGDTRGLWDHDRLGQVLSNLVGNALRHGTPGAPVRVRIDGTVPHEVILQVQNGGVIPKDLLSRLFEPFRRGPGTQRDGLGLGLFIVQHLVRAHGGDIEVTSSGDLTCVRMRLPRSPRGAAGSSGWSGRRGA
jgi:signal transduction histidine kinase